MSKRLSALAQLVRIYAERGVMRTSELVAITGYSRRSIETAKCELRCAHPAADCAWQPAAHTRQPAAIDAAADCASEISPPPLKKKGLPHTPSKEKTNPPTGFPVDRVSNPITVEQVASAPAAAKIREGASDDQWLAVTRKADRTGVHREAIQPLADTHGLARVEAALDRMIARVVDGEVFRKPASMLARICEDIRANPPRAPHVPLGAIDLGGGRYLSRFGGGFGG